jgi:hypothetical protein
MFLAACVFLWVTSLLGVLLFGFLFGRCARKLPIIDETLPWILHWGQVAPACGRDAAAPGQTQAESSWTSKPAKATRPTCGTQPSPRRAGVQTASSHADKAGPGLPCASSCGTKARPVPTCPNSSAPDWPAPYGHNGDHAA